MSITRYHGAILRKKAAFRATDSWLLNGTTSHAVLPDDCMGTSNRSVFTAAAWVKLTSNGNFPVIISSSTASQSDLFELRFSAATRQLNALNRVGSVFTMNFTVDAGDAIALDTWAHVAMVYDSGSCDLFVDGSNVKTGADTETAIAIDQECRIGEVVGTLRFPGHVADVRVWDTDLSDAQVSDAKDGKNVLPSNLLLWYKCNEGSGTTAVDSSGNSQDGTLSAVTHSTDGPY